MRVIGGLRSEGRNLEVSRPQWQSAVWPLFIWTNSNFNNPCNCYLVFSMCEALLSTLCILLLLVSVETPEFYQKASKEAEWNL